MRTTTFLVLPLLFNLVACGGSNDPGVGQGGGGGSGTSHGGGAANGDDAGASSATAEGGNGSSSAGAATCASTFTALCNQAWSCGKDACRFALENDAGTAFGSMSWTSVSECTNFWIYTCSMPGGVRSDFDFDACTQAIATSACTSTKQGPALVYPQVCNVNEPGH